MTSLNELAVDHWTIILKFVPKFSIPVLFWVSKSINNIILEVIEANKWPTQINRLTFLQTVVKHFDSVSLMKWGCDLHCALDSSLIEEVAKFGRKNVFEWIIRQSLCHITPAVKSKAVKHGRLNILEIIQSNDCGVAHNEWVAANTVQGNLEYVETTLDMLAMIRHFDDYDRKTEQKISYIAAKHGHLEIFRLAYLKNMISADTLFNCALRSGNLDFCKEIYEIHTATACTLYLPNINTKVLVKKGYLHILKWCAETIQLTQPPKYPFPINFKTVCKYAARYGHIHILEWILETNNLYVESDTTFVICSAAAEGGQFETLKWAREHGCGWNYRTFNMIATNGSREMFEWACQNGCIQFPTDVIKILADRCHYHLLQWYLKQVVEKINETHYYDVLTSFAIAGNFEALKWFHSQGYQLSGELINLMIAHGDMKIANWISEQGYSYNYHTMDFAVEKSCSLEMIQWVIKEGGTTDDIYLDTIIEYAHNNNKLMTAPQWINRMNDRDIQLDAVRILYWLGRRGHKLPKTAHNIINKYMDKLKVSKQ